MRQISFSTSVPLVCLRDNEITYIKGNTLDSGKGKTHKIYSHKQSPKISNKCELLKHS